MRTSRQLMRRERLSIHWSHRPPNAPLGRFGGGWQWSVGIRVGRRTAIVDLLIGTVRIERPAVCTVPEQRRLAAAPRQPSFLRWPD